MRLNRIPARWSAPLASAGAMLLIGTVGITSGCGSGGAERIDNTVPTPTTSPTSTPTPTPTPTGQTNGVVRVVVNWPSRTGKLVPLASQSVDVVLLDSSRTVLTRVLAKRPTGTSGDDASTSTVILSPVPPGSYYIAAAAYPIEQPAGDGSTVAQAYTLFPVSVASGQTQEFTLSLQSLITNLAINTPSSGQAITVTVGQSTTISTTATNAAGATVLTSKSQLVFSSSNPAVATVDSSGNVKGVSTGQTTITVTDSESGKSAQATVYVTDQPAP